MTSRWLIFFSVFPWSAAMVLAAGLSGRVELTGASVKDRSGVVVWLQPATFPASLPEVRAVMKQKGKTFLPHVLAVPTGSTVDFPNLDPIFHNAFSSFDGKIFDVGLYPPGASRAVRFSRPGVVRVFCNIHPMMSAVIVVVDTPWLAVSQPDGAFEIPDVPPGDYTLHVYHERATPAVLAARTRPVVLGATHVELPVIVISETGYLPPPHKNKFGKDYPDQVTYSNHAP